MNDTNSTAESPLATVYLSMAQAARMYGVCPDTPLQWMKRGIQSPAGIVLLRGRKIGGRFKTTVEWLEEFFAACEGGDGTPVAEPPSKLEKRRRREKQRAEELLRPKRKRQLGKESKREAS